MNVRTQVDEYLAGLAEPTAADMQSLHQWIVGIAPENKLWFLDGRDEKGKVVSNPSIGYGLQSLPLARGATREFYRVGISANTAGMSVYVMGLSDKTYLSRTYASSLGKAKVTAYCIKFKKLADVNFDVLQAAIRHGLTAQRPSPTSSSAA